MNGIEILSHFSFVTLVNQQVGLKRSLNSELVAAFVVRMVVVAFDPLEGDLMFVIDLQKPFPHVRVGFLFKIGLDPVEDPAFFYRIDYVLGIGINFQVHQ